MVFSDGAKIDTINIEVVDKCFESVDSSTSKMSALFRVDSVNELYFSLLKWL